jgi:hypothetical protein
MVKTSEGVSTAAWREARGRFLRAPRITVAHRPVFNELIRLIDFAGAQLETLQRVYDAERPIGRTDASSQLLHFMDGDLGDAFKGLTSSATLLLPIRRGWKRDADPLEAAGGLDLVVRYLHIASLAAESSVVRGDVRHAFTAAGSALSSWGPELRAVIDRITDVHLTAREQ